MNGSAPIDGVLLIDKPTGPTSHDVVARLRRVLGQRSIGHTGTLDPLASGLLALVLGRATRLASILTGRDKTYDASIRLGFATTTDDALGAPLETGPSRAAATGDEAVRAALEGFRGTFAQLPPAHSAKKVGGVKAYERARRDEPVALARASVTVKALDWLGRDGDVVHVRVTATAGFYVRSLARDLGAALGCGGHLTALRRIRSGAFRLEDALPLSDAERAGVAVAARVIAPAAALPHLAEVRLTDDGIRRVIHGQWVGPEHWAPPPGAGAAPEGGPADDTAPVKLVSARDGRLVALARARGGTLHPVVVLG